MESIIAKRIKKIAEIISNFLKTNNVQKLDSLFIIFIDGDEGWYRFHSVAGNYLNVVDSNLYGGSIESIRRKDDEKKRALETDSWTNSLYFGGIKEIFVQNKESSGGLFKDRLRLE